MTYIFLTFPYCRVMMNSLIQHAFHIRLSDSNATRSRDTNVYSYVHIKEPNFKVDYFGKILYPLLNCTDRCSCHVRWERRVYRICFLSTCLTKLLNLESYVLSVNLTLVFETTSKRIQQICNITSERYDSNIISFWHIF